MADDRLLLVEGDDELHVFLAILAARNFSPHFPIDPQKNYQKILKGLGVRLTVGSSITRLGIVIDADADLADRWKDVHKILIKAGYSATPSTPDPDGTIVSETDLPTVGIWLMPDNVLRGTLEDFLKLLVPDGDLLWNQAIKSVDEAIVIEKKFKDQYQNKAIIHTYLAWQRDPGVPMGRAITMRCFLPESPHADKFIGWLSRLFS